MTVKLELFIIFNILSCLKMYNSCLLKEKEDHGNHIVDMKLFLNQSVHLWYGLNNLT